METLTKENFWNRIKEKYPDAFKVFGEWVNGYKVDNSWKQLFTSHDCECPSDYSDKDNSPKYHELPVALQWGIFTQFIYETVDSIPNIHESQMTLACEDYISEIKKVIEDFFIWLNRKIVNGEAGR